MQETFCLQKKKENCLNKVLMFLIISFFQALEEVWKIACAMYGRITIVFPPEKEFLIYPIDIGGPCRSKITLKVCLKITSSM